MSDLLIRGGRLFDPTAQLDAVGDLLIRQGEIAAVGAVDAGRGEEVIEAEGLLVVPGLLDLHVHLREPGQEHKETVATGTRAAAAGGFTAVACEPNTDPPRDDPDRLAEVQQIAARTGVVRVLPKCAITRGQQGREVTDLAALRAAGAVAASDDGFSVTDAAVMETAMLAAKRVGLPLTVHVDDPKLMARDIGLAEKIGWAVHFSHVSLAAEVDLIARAQEKGLAVTGEATPHHLCLIADEARAGEADFKMNPPLRRASDREALRRALADGVVSVIASDHAPHAPAEKSARYEDAPAGVIGLETTVGVVWTSLVREGVLSRSGAVRALTAAPAAVLGRDAPGLRVGAAADVTVLDEQGEWVVNPERFESRARNCPFAGWRLRGKAVATIVGGRMVMREGLIMNTGETA